MIANDADTLDQLLQLQLRVVDQKLARAKQARALQPMQAAHVQPVSEARRVYEQRRLGVTHLSCM